MAEPLLQVRNLEIGFHDAQRTRAVSDISYDIDAGDTLGIVGESGSGKSLQALAIMGLLPQRSVWVRGQILFEGRDLLTLSPPELRKLRGNRIGMIFQDPMSSLNPVLTVGRQIAEGLIEHKGLSMKDARARAVELLDMVRIPQAARRVGQYPFQFSGGMRQRVMIAIALSCNPRLLIGDEPTTALDVTVQGQIIALIQELKRELDLAIMWITHDMGVVAAMANTVQVHYGGRILERGPMREVFRDPRNAYTWALLRATPQAGQQPGTPLWQLQGQAVTPYNCPPGDPFAPRNPFATPRCHTEMPPLRQAGNGASPGHLTAAWYDLPAALALRAANGKDHHDV